MDKNKLLQAQADFFAVYPGGFEDPAMAEIAKKHKMSKHVEFAKAAFSPEALGDIEATAENAARLVSRSSMVSVFEKPRFRDAVRAMSGEGHADLATGLGDLLHGNEARGFHQLLGLLSQAGLAKWTLITVWRCYVFPKTDLLFKPTTVKNVIANFGLTGLTYKPRPSYDFFVEYRQAVRDMAAQCDARLSPSLAAFSGFLMMSMT